MSVIYIIRHNSEIKNKLNISFNMIIAIHWFNLQKLTNSTVKINFLTDESVKMQITDSISENLIDSGLESSLILWISVLWRSILSSRACLIYYCLPDTCTLQIDYSREVHTANPVWESFHVLWKKYIYIYCMLAFWTLYYICSY